jgi:RNA polymerase sigma-70 factor, ECF subfamily
LLAWTRLAQLDDAQVFASWLGTIARHRAVDFYRKAHPTEQLDERMPDSRTMTSSDLAEVNTVLAAIRALPEAYQETLLMRLCEGMSGPEIAELTGLEPGSVRINLHRGMKLLRERLGVETKVAANE